MTDSTEFLQWLHRSIPLTAAMQIDELNFDGETLSLSAPLEPNINDKGTGFAGATSGLATLSGWAILTLWLQSRDIEADVMVAKSELQYLAPVTGRFTSSVQLPDADDQARFLSRFSERGRARMALQVSIGPPESPQLILSGDYAAVKRS